jgi:ribosomal protein L16/L10AE
VKPGKILFEMEGVAEETAREAFRLGACEAVDRPRSFVKRQALR